MGTLFSSDKPTQEASTSIIHAADTAVSEVSKTQDEIQEKLKDLQNVIQRQKDNVNTLEKARADAIDHVSKTQRDDYSGPMFSKQTCTGSCDHEQSKENTALKAKMKKLESDLAEGKKKFDKQNKTFATESRKSQAEIRELKSEKCRQQNQIKQLECERKSHIDKIQDLENKIKLTEERIRLAKQKKVRVSLYSGNHATLMDASAELTTMLCSHWEAIGIQATVEQCLDPGAHPGTTPLITLCINASRLGTDVSNATQNIHCNQSVAVVILHHKEYHALPSQPSEKLLVGAQYRQLGAIVDIAFLKTKGLYTCDMNERALDKLTAFVSNFVQQG